LRRLLREPLRHTRKPKPSIIDVLGATTERTARPRYVAQVGWSSLAGFSDWGLRGQAAPFRPRPDNVASVGHSLLFAVGAGPPHDGVRRTRRLNLLSDLAGIGTCRLEPVNEIASTIVPTGTIRLPLTGSS
jgi:hypothetical protein